MNVVFRCDASLSIGSGHVMRCLTLANALAAHGVRATFVSRAAAGNLNDRVAAAGHELIALPAEIESWADDACATAARLAGRPPFILVTDHYAIDASWQRVLRSSAAAIAVIEDAVEHELDCDIVLDQTPAPDARERYRRYAGPHAQLFLGLRYVLLRPEFERVRVRVEPRAGHIARVLIFMSGAALPALTARAIAAVRRAVPSAEIDVIGAPPVDARADPAVRYHQQPADLAALMLRADLALGTLGHASYERAVCGLPSLVVTVSPRQAAVGEAFVDSGLLALVPGGSGVSESAIAQAIGTLAADPARVSAMSRAAIAAMAATEPVESGGLVLALLAAGESAERGR